MAVVCAMGAAAIGTVSPGAEAFELKHTSANLPIRWTEPQVSYAIDPSVEGAIADGARAASTAVGAWNGAAGTPTLSTVAGSPGGKPGLDGQNTILFAPDGFAPAHDALAVSIVSYEEKTGAVVDADIVLNGIYRFAVLASDATAKADVSFISTDGASGAGNATDGKVTFDLLHVMSHEVGHTLGLADERSDPSALMYALTQPGDASRRVPSSDDVHGVGALYGDSPAPLAGAVGHAGCGQASLAGPRTRPADAWGALALAAVVGMWLAWRRNRKAALAMLPLAAAVVALVAAPGRALSAPHVSVLLTDASALVTRVSTSNVGGLFETTVELTPTACRAKPCPARMQAHAWGGTLGGITQRVGGEMVPSLGDAVDIAFIRANFAFLPLAQVVRRHQD
jgi:hypothetical protein